MLARLIITAATCTARIFHTSACVYFTLLMWRRGLLVSACCATCTRVSKDPDLILHTLSPSAETVCPFGETRKAPASTAASTSSTKNWQAPCWNAGQPLLARFAPAPLCVLSAVAPNVAACARCAMFAILCHDCPRVYHCVFFWRNVRVDRFAGIRTQLHARQAMVWLPPHNSVAHGLGSLLQLQCFHVRA
jgi:hypothetical protein